MNQNLFVSFILALALGFVQLHSSLKTYFNSTDRIASHVEKLEKKISYAQFQTQLVRFQFEEFRNEVGSLLPNAIQKKGKGEKSYPLRRLASVISQHDETKMRLSKARDIFERGKRAFNAEDYKKANDSFQTLIKFHPYSVNIVEAHLLSMESLFRTRRFEQCLDVVKQMVELFPEDQMTGFALLRMGKIYEFQDRREDALDIYKTVLNSFSQKAVVSQAQTSLNGLEL
jgi:TolA-binding protein